MKERELITLVGAGGKTTLMFALANELLAGHKKIITTTTTKIYPPEPGQSPALILGGREVFPEIEEVLARYGHITGPPAGPRKINLPGYPCPICRPFGPRA